MRTVEFLSSLLEKDILVWTEGDQLKYRAPAGAMTPELRLDLAARRCEIINFLERSNVTSTSSGLTIRPATRTSALPLSFGQERLWFLDKMVPGAQVYNIPVAIRIRGELDRKVLEEAITEIVRRHEILRTTFKLGVNGPVQVVHAAERMTVECIDLRPLDSCLRRRRLHEATTRAAEHRFDLENGPLLRTSLLQVENREHVLLLTIHHIVFDGWSAEILAREFVQLYEAFSRGKESPLPNLPIQYADYAVWQRKWLQPAVMDRQLAYWSEHLSGLEPLELPTDRPRPAMRSFRGASQGLNLSVELTERLKKLSREEGVTLFILLSTVLKVLLWRYTGQVDIAIGTPIAIRDKRETEGLIGFFVNTLVLRSTVRGEWSFKKLLKQERKAAFEAYANQDVPFEKVVQELQLQRHLSRDLLFQVMIVLQNAPLDGLKLECLEFEPLAIEQHMSNFDLTLSFAEGARGLGGSIEYSTDLFDQDRIQRLAVHFIKLLDQIVNHPERRISELAILSSQENEKLLVDWNDNRCDYPNSKCIHELFEDQVERTPDIKAVIFKEHELSYYELNRRANKLAHYLRKMEVGPEVLVGICMERSLEMVVGMLGILKAGGGFVPLDPTHPKQRLAYMLSDTQSKLLLTTEEFAKHAPMDKGKVICIDALWSDIDKEDSLNPTKSNDEKNIAYVIYTSASTGDPKGVVVSHRSLVNHNVFIKQMCAFKPGERVLQFASFGFDASLEEMFPPWLSGGTVVLRTNEMLGSVREFMASLTAWRICVINLPTAFWHTLVEEIADFDLPKTVRLVIIGGEAAKKTAYLRWKTSRNVEAGLINTYGPTEATITATWYKLGRDDSELDAPSFLPIGRPISNTAAYILNAFLELTPIGIPGELYIAGEGLARGYFGNPKLTAEKFIPNPFSDRPGARLYSTGDKVRYSQNGNIEFLGRVDDQVKIRGFRIGLGEIEARLSEHSDVKECVVSAFEDESGEKHLGAYVVLKRGKKVSGEQLKRYLKEKLPEYMLPSRSVFLERLPLTANGKVDRKALPKFTRVRTGDRMPRSRLEQHVSKIWSEILGVEGIGLDEVFFEIGGHSLKAVQLAARIREQLAVEMNTTDVFRSPTVRAQAQLCKARVTETAGRNVKECVSMRPIRRTMSMGQEYRWGRAPLDELRESESNVVHSVRISGDFRPEIAKRVLQLVCDHCEALRTAFILRKDGLRMKIFPKKNAIVDFKEYRSEDLITPGIGPAYEPMNLLAVPLLRGGYARETSDSWIFWVAMSHLATDGWSCQLLIERFWRLYEQLENRNSDYSSVLEEKVPYSAFVDWESRQLADGSLQLAAGKRVEDIRRSGGSVGIKLPVDVMSGVDARREVREISIVLEYELTRDLKTWASQDRLGLLALLINPLAILLRALTGGKKFIVGSVAAGRPMASFEQTVGYFMNPIPLLLQVSDEGSFRDLAEITQRSVSEALDYYHVPYGMIIERFGQEAMKSGQVSPIFFYLQKFGDWKSALRSVNGLKFEPLHDPTLKIKDDITIQAYDGDQIHLRWIYNGALFRDGTMQRWIDVYKLILRKFTATRDAPLREVLNTCSYELQRDEYQ